MRFVEVNGRTIPREDKIFAINGRAKAMAAEKGKDKVANATIGALLDDEGDLIVMASVVAALKELSPADFAEYAPISGLPGFKEAVKKALFGTYRTDRFVEVCASPGGTGAVRNAISNYSKPGDIVLTSDWFWAPYRTIAQEIGRDLTTYTLFTEEGGFNLTSFAGTAEELVDRQGSVVIILNTPAHNPTGYSLTDEDWQGVVRELNRIAEKGRVTLLMDVAYIDFAGDETECRFFFSRLEELSDKVLPLLAYSASKTLTLYGMRCGALVCMTKDEEAAEEFRRAAEFSSRGSWSNCARAGQVIMDKVFNDEALMDKVAEERAFFRDQLLARGRVFEETLRREGVMNVPFDAGFFTCVACEDPDAVSAALEKEGIFVVPLAKGVRISVASLSEEKCIRAAKAVAAVCK